jgi:hypothetical protein
MPSVITVEEEVGAFITGTVPAPVPVAVPMIFVVALTLAVALTFAVALALAVVPAFAVVPAALAFGIAILVGRTAIDLAAGLTPALLLSRSPTISIVSEVDTVACQCTIPRSYLHGQVAQDTPYAFEERKVCGGRCGFAYRRAKGGACYARRFRECSVAVSRRIKSRPGLGAPQ